MFNHSRVPSPVIAGRAHDESTQRYNHMGILGLKVRGE